MYHTVTKTSNSINNLAKQCDIMWDILDVNMKVYSGADVQELVHSRTNAKRNQEEFNPRRKNSTYLL